MTKIMPFSTLFSIKFSFFLLFFAIIFLFSGCGGNTKPESVSNADEDSTDADFGTDEEEDWEEDEETEESEENSDNDNKKTDIDIEPVPKPDNDRDSDKDSDTEKPDEDDGKPTRSECLAAGGKWNSEDEFCFKRVYCDEKPANSYWNFGLGAAADRDNDYVIYYKNGEWGETYATEYDYDKEGLPCKFVCKPLYFWNGSECINACDPNPCYEIENSNGLCRQFSHFFYLCDCNIGYSWQPEQCVKHSDKVAFGRLCTGQRRCYDNDNKPDYNPQDFLCPSSEDEEFFGQDAYYAYLGKCIQKDFSLKKTGIENENTIVDNNLKLEWQQTISKDYFYWEKAIKYCEDLEYGGYNDWRLPTPKEFISIIDHYRAYVPEYNETYFWYFTEKIERFWTSAPLVSDHELAWYLDLYDKASHILGYSSVGNSRRRVRCVRGETPGNASFKTATVNGDEIVTDSTTGLIWQKNDASGKKWQEALEYCEKLIYAGYSDWRLPNINELASLLNYDKYAPASDFPDISHEYFWSSTTYMEYENYALNLFFHNGYFDLATKNVFYNVKCVR